MKPRCQQSHAASESSGEVIPRPFPASGGGREALAYGRLSPFSTSVLTVASALRVCASVTKLPSYKGTRHCIRAHLIQDDLCFHYIHKISYSQMMSHSQVPRVRMSADLSEGHSSTYDTACFPKCFSPFQSPASKV